MTDTVTVSQRLGKLRKHLGERLGKELTLAELSEMSGVRDNMIQRMESGLKGSTQTLVTLLTFYRSYNYNLDWILTGDNSQIPMMLSDINELQQISEDMMELSEQLQEGYAKLNDRLRNMGYQPFERKRLVESEAGLPSPVGLAL